MDYEIIFKAVSVFGGAVGVGRILYEIVIGKRSRMREEYKFARDFFDELARNNNMHPFLREKGYQAIAGDNLLGADEAEYLLSLQRPARALRDYVLGRYYLEHLSQDTHQKIEFKEKYKAKWARLWRMYFYGGMYFVSIFLSFAPLILSSFLTLKFADFLTILVMTVTLFGPCAWLALKAGARIYRAEQLVENQHKHTPRIVVTKERALERSQALMAINKNTGLG